MRPPARLCHVITTVSTCRAAFIVCAMGKTGKSASERKAEMAEQSKRSEALAIAIHMEKKGIEFYHKAGERHSHTFGKRMFLSLAADEKRHVRVFEEMAEREGLRPGAMDEIDKEGPIQRISAIFREVSRQVSEEMQPTDDDIRVIEIAKGLEQEAYDFYIQTAKTVSDAKEKRILEKIADEENQHYRILEDTRLYLTDPAEWNLKEEKPLIDGG